MKVSVQLNLNEYKSCINTFLSVDAIGYMYSGSDIFISSNLE